MTNDPEETTDLDSSNDANDSIQTLASSTYKVLGEFSDGSGAGVLGKNTASNGTPIGVEGSVPNSSAGYGLYTSDDAKIDGRLAGGRMGLPPADTIGTDPQRVRNAMGAIFDEPAWTTPRYTAGPSHGEGSNAFARAVLAPSGEVILAPLNSSNVGVVDTNAQTVRPRVTALHPLVNNS